MRQALILPLAIGALAACEEPAEKKPPVVLSVEDQDQARARNLKDVLEVDSDFSDMAQSDGVAAAFAAYMDATDGQMIQPGAVIKGEEAIRMVFADWPENMKLIWEPDSGYAASDGDFAVTTGRFKRTQDDKVLQEGRYVTVWRKNGAGDWKGVMDIGQPDAPLPAPDNPDDKSGAKSTPKDGGKPKKDK